MSIPAGGLVLDLDDPNNMQATLHIAYDMYPHWVQIAQEHARECRKHAQVVSEIWTSGGRPEEVDALEAELRSGMQAIVAAVTAIEGFYGTVVAVSGRPNRGKKRTARARVVAETMKQRFDLPADKFSVIRSELILLYTLRDQAVHPTGDTGLPAFHPRLQTHTEQRFANFRAENATAAADEVMALLLQFAHAPKADFPPLVDHCRFAKERLMPIRKAREEELGKRIKFLFVPEEPVD